MVLEVLDMRSTMSSSRGYFFPKVVTGMYAGNEMVPCAVHLRPLYQPDNKNVKA